MLLRHPDEQLALDVVRHLLGARAAAFPIRDRLPLTEATFRAVARKLGRPAGIKRCRAMPLPLREAQEIIEDLKAALAEFAVVAQALLVKEDAQ